MTQNVSELHIPEQRLEAVHIPLDADIAKGIALSGLFCATQQALVSERIDKVFEEIRTDEKPYKERGHTIALAVGKISLEVEDDIDAWMQRTASEQNHGVQSGQRERSPFGDLVWAGYDPNSIRFLTLFKRTTPLLMTSRETPITTIWHVKALPAR